jgi:hypothetical protein
MSTACLDGPAQFIQRAFDVASSFRVDWTSSFTSDNDIVVRSVKLVPQRSSLGDVFADYEMTPSESAVLHKITNGPATQQIFNRLPEYHG